MHIARWHAHSNAAQGIAAQAMGGTEWGMWIILACSAFGVIFLAAATCVARYLLAAVGRHAEC
jgi:hypothetical protein